MTISLNSSSLTLQKTGGPTLTLARFKLTDSVDLASSGAYSVYGSGQVTDSALNGYISFTIPQSTPFAGVGGQNPSSGVMTVTGANHSSVTITAIDSTTVQLQVDTDGDGKVDYTFTEPWTSLSS